MLARISSASSSCFATRSSSGTASSVLRWMMFDRPVGAHHRDLGGRPGDDVVRLVRQAVHDEVPGAVALAQDDADLRDGRLAHREQHLGPVPDDPLLLDRRADDEAGHVVEEHERDAERVAEPDEARRLVGRVRRRARRPAPSAGSRRCRSVAHRRGPDPSRRSWPSPASSERTSPSSTTARMTLRMSYARARRGRDDVVQLVDPAVDRVGAVAHRRRFTVVLREEREVVAHDLEALGVVARPRGRRPR